jgi:hypothetical protein
VVTAAIEEECKWTAQFGQIKHVGGNELRLNPGGASALFRSFHSQWRQVDADCLKALLGQPHAIRSRSTADIEDAARLNGVPTHDAL